jgi:hypothetical protein
MKALRRLMVCFDLCYIGSKGPWGCISSSFSLLDVVIDASLFDASLVDASLPFKPNILHYGLRDN